MKYHMLYLYILLTMFTSCDKKDEQNQSTLIDVILEFSFEDNNGNDLLNPAFTNSYKHEDLKVYCLDNGDESILANNESLHFISNERGVYTLFIPLSHDTTYLKLSEDITDTIRSEHEIGSNYNYIIKVWYNSNLVWNRDAETALVKIVK
ncbi:hypothetical protein [Marinifilum sp.]|uniref:hypothetical protein n=1 Tax=Marinifilum sp. TaxID=2033137 RepID=UPI003BAD1F8E